MKRFNLNDGGLIIFTELEQALKLERIFLVENNSNKKIAHRTNQLQASQNLVNHFIDSSAILEHLETGKPHMVGNNLELSISHTNEFITIMAHPRMAAIDIEHVKRNITQIGSRFANQTELDHLGQSFQNPLLHLWTIKECLFKAIETTAVSFKDHLNVIDCKTVGSETQAKCLVNHPNIKGELITKSYIFDEHILTYIDTPIVQ